MNLEQITKQLDEKFNVQNIPPDMPFSRVMPKIYDMEKIDFRKYLTDDFLQNFHGLMIKNSKEVNKVYLTVFLSEEILDKIFTKAEKNVLIFSHHPVEMETSNRGFLPLREKYFIGMKKRRISVYTLHTPLDINEAISTSLSIAKVLELKNITRYHKNSIGFSGIIGCLSKEIKFEEFIKYLKKIFNLQEIHYAKRFNNVFKIGIIAGGGADVEYIKESIDLGCDTYLSGDYENKIKNEYSIQKRKEFDEVRDLLEINLIECSHYATEKLVIINDIRNLFESYGLNTMFIEQNDAWH